MLLNILLLIVGQVAGSTAVIAIKASTLNPVVLASMRLIVAAAALTPLYLRESARLGRSRREMASAARLSLLPGLFLAIHFVSWNYGARATVAANASLIVNLMPVAMPFIIYGMTREVITLREIIGTVIAIIGVMVLTGADVRLSGSTVTGDLVCFGSMIFFSLYMGLARRNNRQPSLWLYIVPVYWFAGVLTLFAGAAAVTLGKSVGQAASALAAEMTPANVLLALYLGLVPTIIGHTMYNRSMRVLPSQLVSLSMLTQFIFAGAFAFVLFREVPSPLLLPAALLVVCGASLVIFDRKVRSAGGGHDRADRTLRRDD